MANKLSPINLGCFSRGLVAAILAAVLGLAAADEAHADFDSAVAAYDRGDYQAAQAEFGEISAAGDERAKPYLDSIQQELNRENDTEDSLMSAIIDALRSIFAEPDRPTIGPAPSGAVAEHGGSPTSRPMENASPRKPEGWKPWSPADGGEETVPTASPQDDVVVPQRDTVWSTVFHLPGDATVVGLQYAALFLDADTLSRELQAMSRHRGEISLSILTGFWWLVIVRGLVGLALALSRIMKAATPTKDEKRYG